MGKESEIAKIPSLVRLTEELNFWTLAQKCQPQQFSCCGSFTFYLDFFCPESNSHWLSKSWSETASDRRIYAGGLYVFESVFKKNELDIIEQFFNASSFYLRLTKVDRGCQKYCPVESRTPPFLFPHSVITTRQEAKITPVFTS